ncbi:alpha-farnesene synthase-like isoform X1 [Coffea arabica]|uniref:Alpha-farnesene synthase-like isoform X1 n=1 Tax=Coffea arabica TaxID=13443 RepID=A0A6P6VKZ5_COFAR
MNSRIGSFNHHTLIFSSSTSSLTSVELQPLSSPQAKAGTNSDKIDQSVQRRTANYKPNIWKHELLQSLTSQFSEKKYKTRAQTLKEDVKCMFVEASDTLSKLELIDSISKLGLDKYFMQEIKEALDATALSNNTSVLKGDLYATALCFRLLRHHGYHASQDMFLDFVDGADKFIPSPKVSIKGLLELLQASNLGGEGEDLLTEAGLFSIENLSGFGASSDNMLAKQVYEAISLPMQWRVEWYNVKKHVQAHEKNHESTKSKLIELAKLNFNLVQSSHQEDLKEVSRWWMNLGIKERLSFSRDRVVESFLYAAGTAPEPKQASLRKWLSKVINLILITDDVYDVYGTLDELEIFTNAVERWSPEEIKELPEGIQICFWTLLNTTNEMAAEIEQENGWTPVLPYLQKTWTDFLKSLLVEAKWYNKGYTPSLEEYLNNGWISSSGPLLSVLAILGVADRKTQNVAEYLKDCQQIIHHSSLVIRLCNDQGTSAAELERGDAASSILCYMREANVSEEVAREHIKSLIVKAWKQINGYCISCPPFLQEPAKYITNTARVAHFMYQHGDGFGVQDRETQDHVRSNFIEPIPIN